MLLDVANLPYESVLRVLESAIVIAYQTVGVADPVHLPHHLAQPCQKAAPILIVLIDGSRRFSRELR